MVEPQRRGCICPGARSNHTRMRTMVLLSPTYTIHYNTVESFEVVTGGIVGRPILNQETPISGSPSQSPTSSPNAPTTAATTYTTAHSATISAAQHPPRHSQPTQAVLTPDNNSSEISTRRGTRSARSARTTPHSATTAGSAQSRTQTGLTGPPLPPPVILRTSDRTRNTNTTPHSATTAATGSSAQSHRQVVIPSAPTMSTTHTTHTTPKTRKRKRPASSGNRCTSSAANSGNRDTTSSADTTEPILVHVPEIWKHGFYDQDTGEFTLISKAENEAAHTFEDEAAHPVKDEAVNPVDDEAAHPVDDKISLCDELSDRERSESNERYSSRDPSDSDNILYTYQSFF
ncbi:hypothetical protein SARC_00852 [Sphaeroforma arctica JP610]|uniref:Uncharacterized protein n=1 Tax=Sphaeroforma arctica JP610 TaxID=667725 RepID=A0A0L0GDF2_9EUKA|nr:hypothetical protein SARC_00852 [Sphaeroforma arctica JP610]KNC87042.1 hypothetical protein SARC_00852 [Sphaeroforma arctica JP610]|eukprot:XP_014160944.1 hypothetical protein SARC_00852 [Sphaeroforma arctica JP610]